MPMNKAHAQRIDVGAAAGLIEPLTELVIRAGAAILAVNRSAMKIDGKLDGSLVTEGKPLLGIVGAPALGLVWRGLVGRGAERLSVVNMSIKAIEPIRTRPFPPPGKPWTAAVSRSHGDARTEAFIDRRPGATRA